jgi:hypothetical protein
VQTPFTTTFGSGHVQPSSTHWPGAGHDRVVHIGSGGVHAPVTSEFGGRHMHLPSTQAAGSGQFRALHAGGEVHAPFGPDTLGDAQVQIPFWSTRGGAQTTHPALDS